jgi:hypothetical protein
MAMSAMALTISPHEAMSKTTKPRKSKRLC